MMATVAALRESANPIVWFRALLMDLGFAGLIEEIEKRFGKLVTSLVLGCLLLAIFLWALQLVGEALVEAERLMAIGGTWEMAKSLGIRIGILLTVAAIVFGFFYVRLDNAGRRHRDAAAALNRESEDRLAREWEEFERREGERRAEYRERREELDADREKLAALIEEADRRIERLRNGDG